MKEREKAFKKLLIFIMSVEININLKYSMHALYY